MNAHRATVCRAALRLPIISCALFVVGCGGGYMAPPAQQQPPPPPAATLEGSWEIHFQSLVTPSNATVVEANLSQSGAHVFSGAPGTLAYRGTGPDAVEIPLTQFGGNCDSGGNDQVVFDGMLTTTGSTRTITLTVTETGTLGSSVITGTASTDGSQFTSGTYSIPAACGFAEDHGTFEGFRDSFQLNPGDTFSGTFNGGADAIVMRFANDATGFGITASGTDNGTPFSIPGSTTGLSVTLSETVSGNTVTWFGVYNTTYNWISFYGPDGKLLGKLSSK
jgi:hypothetical protein